jgi:hypothetical protein
MAWENSLLVTILIPLLGSFTLPLLGLWSPRVRNLWAIFLGCVTFFSALSLLPGALSGKSLVFSFSIGMGLDALFLLMVSGMNGLVLTTRSFQYVRLSGSASGFVLRPGGLQPKNRMGSRLPSNILCFRP